MPKIIIDNRNVIPIFNTTSTLQSWLRPGLFAYIIGCHVDALKPHAVRLYTEHNAMLDECAQRYPEGHEKAGQRVEGATPGFVVFKSEEAGEQYRIREKELMDATTEIRVDLRLTLERINTFDRERLDAPRSLNGAPPPTEAIDFTALMLIVERPNEAVQESPSSE